MRFIVVLDACVLYPAPLRDYLMRLALTDLFTPKWTAYIHEEWMRNLIEKRPELAGNLERTRDLMNTSFPDANVEGYEQLIDGLELPDPNDRHVLAAAIYSSAQAIVTFNLKDFPQEALQQHDIELIHPDTFIEHQFYLSRPAVIGAAKNHRAALLNPEKTVEEYLETMAAQGLPVTADLLRDFSSVI